jgi:hypothetical protein
MIILIVIKEESLGAFTEYDITRLMNELKNTNKNIITEYELVEILNKISYTWSR